MLILIFTKKKKNSFKHSQNIPVSSLRPTCLTAFGGASQLLLAPHARLITWVAKSSFLNPKYVWTTLNFKLSKLKDKLKGTDATFFYQ